MNPSQTASTSTTVFSLSTVGDDLVLHDLVAR